MEFCRRCVFAINDGWRLKREHYCPILGSTLIASDGSFVGLELSSWIWLSLCSVIATRVTTQRQLLGFMVTLTFTASD